MLQLLKNPFYIYPVSFFIVFITYSLGWSNLFPSLSIATILFFVITFILSFIIGMIVDVAKLIKFEEIEEGNTSKHKKYILLIFIGYVIEFIYFDNIPLLTLINGTKGTLYTEFGIKVFHVLLVTFNSFYIVYLFHFLISKRSKKALFYYILCYIPLLLIVHRGGVIVGLMSSLFVYILSRKKNIPIKKIAMLLVLSAGILYGFGYIGNLRSAHGHSDYIPRESKATKTFLNSKVPKEYYWTYLYLGSPLANFQNNINNTKDVSYNVFSLFAMECLPDIISKRVEFIFDVDRLGHYQIASWLTVGTVYSKSYSYAKWGGPIIMFVFSIVVIFFLLILVPKTSKYHVTAIAIISTLTFFNTFSNMFSFSGISLQLFYAILFSLLEGKRLVIKKWNTLPD